MTDRDVKNIEERLNALSRVVTALAEKVTDGSIDSRDPHLRLSDLHEIRRTLRLRGGQ